MHSRRNIRRRKLARRVESSIHSHTETVAQGLVEFFTPFVPEGQALPDFSALLRLQAWVLNHHRLDFQEKDRAHEKELGNDRELRRIRDDRSNALHAKMSEIAKTFDGAYGEGRCQEILGFGDGLRPEPEQMLELSEQAIERFSQPGFTLPVPKLGGVELRLSDLEAQLSEPHDDLAAAIGALDAEKDKFDATVIAKQQSGRFLEGVTGRHSRLVEELYRIGGHSDLADRLRPTIRSSKSVNLTEAEDDRRADENPSEGGGSEDDSTKGGSSEGTASGDTSSEGGDSEDGGTRDGGSRDSGSRDSGSRDGGSGSSSTRETTTEDGMAGGAAESASKPAPTQPDHGRT